METVDGAYPVSASLFTCERAAGIVSLVPSTWLRDLLPLSGHWRI